jgi:hyperosmotically inducible protein
VRAFFLLFSSILILFCDVSLADSNAISQNSVSDTAITGYVKAKIAMDSSITDDISVTTNNSVVSLSGAMPSDQDANHLITMVQSIKGVKAVDASHLGVKSDEPAISDAMITAQIKSLFVKNKLLGKKVVRLTHIQIETKVGVVMLTGSVGSQEQMDTAIKLAKQVAGVKDVQSKLKMTNYKNKSVTKKMAASIQ